MNAPELPTMEVNDSLEHSVERFAKPDGPFRRASGLERRTKPRVREHFPARILGADCGALPFIIDCVLDNMSSTGLYLRMPRQMPKGGEVKVIVHLLNGRQLELAPVSTERSCVMNRNLMADTALRSRSSVTSFFDLISQSDSIEFRHIVIRTRTPSRMPRKQHASYHGDRGTHSTDIG
jgi:hypothetical protein